MVVCFSYNYAHAYSSEIFENIHHPCPSLVANIRCPSALDCQLRLGVYYSSSVTSGKDILLASTAFSKRELIRGISLDKSGCFTSELVSDYCPGSKAYVEIVEPLRCPLGDGLSPTVSQINHDQNDAEENHINKAGRFLITGNISEVNPIRRKYVFYNEEDCLSPQVEAEEVVWEPKFVAKISSYFVDEFATRLVRSINAWNLRHELERKRQGLFHTDEEALRCGWHRVRITVRAIRIGFCKAQKQREHIRKLVEAEERQQKLLQQHLKSNYGADAHHNHVLHNVYSIVLPVGPVGIQNSDGSGVGSIGLSLLPQNTTASNSLVSGAVPSRSLSSVGEEKRNRTQSADILGASENLIRVHENLFTVGKRVDETAPSTYVDIFIEDR